MLHVPGPFENSLRGGDLLSPTPRTKKLHHMCKGATHGGGNFPPPKEEECHKEEGIFQRNNSRRWSGRRKTKEEAQDELPPVPFPRRNSKRFPPVPKKEEVKSPKQPASLSSDNYSHSDFSGSESLESVEHKSGSKASDHSDDSKAKTNDICSRLFSSTTKSSMAKTAKMRHLDIFDVDESGNWIGNLRKPSEEQDKNKHQSRRANSGERTPETRDRSSSARRDNSKVVAEVLKSPQEESPFVRMNKNSSSFKRKIASIVKPVQSKAESGFSRFGRGSFKFGRKSFKKMNLKTVTYDEISLMSRNKKALGFFFHVDPKECFKEQPSVPTSDLVLPRA